MGTRLRIMLILIGAAAVAAAFTFPLWRPLLVNDVVDEGFPGLAADLQPAFNALTPEQQQMYRSMAAENAAVAAQMANMALGPDAVVPQAEQEMPEMSSPVVAARGTFNEIDAIHKGSGSAIIYQLADNRRVLRLEDFRVTNGPQLHVLLVRSPEPRASADIGTDYIDLGPLKGNVGNQNYEIPAEVDLGQYGSVVIYCIPFSVVFSAAKLSA